MSDELERYKQKRAQERVRRESVVENLDAEWHILKSEARSLDGQEIEGEELRWIEASRSPALILGNVAAFFETHETRVRGVLTKECSVRFDRRPLGSGEMWADKENRLQVLRWVLTLVPDNEHVGCWLVQLTQPPLTASALVRKIAVRLAERSLQYKQEYG